MFDDARSVWELIERRADGDARPRDAVRRRPHDDVRGVPRPASSAPRPGCTGSASAPARNVSWQLPTWTESAVLVGALCRLGAVQNPMLPIYRYREVSFIAKQTGCKLLITPSTWNNFDYGALAEQVAGETDGMHALVADHWNPDGDPATLPPAAPGNDDPADDPVRWIFYTSGTTAEPKGARHTDRSVLAGRDRLREEDPRRRRRHRAGRVPVHARRRHHHRRVHAAAHRLGCGAHGGVDRRRRRPS